MSKKLVVVAGATGRQGGSVVNALLAHGGYAIRGLTRDTASSASKALIAKGVEMVQASLMDKSNLVSAFQGAYAVFGVTVPFTKDSETDMGRNMVDACLANQVPLFVWSSLPSMKEMTGGKYDIPSLEDKAAVDEYIKVVGQPTVTFYTGAFTENLLEHRVGRQLVRTSSPQQWVIHYPIVPSNIPQPMTYVAKDLGPAVLAVIDHWEDDAWKERLLKEPIVLCSYTITGAEMSETVSKVTGKDVKYVAVPADLIREPVKTLFSFFSEYWYPQEIPERILKDLGVSFHSFEDYVREEVVPFLHGEETSN